jgi:hypothetical protein
MRVFKEEQRFTQSWLILLMCVSLIVPIALIIQDYTKPNSSMTLNKFLGSSAIIIASGLFIFIFKLKTRIDEKGIHYRFFPFHISLKTILWSDISKACVRTYDPIEEYGGWGLKGGWSSSKGKAINVKGNIGIQLELKNGKKLLIGTQKETQANQILQKYLKN